MQRQSSEQTQNGKRQPDQANQPRPGESTASHGFRYYTLVIAGIAFSLGIVSWLLGSWPQAGSAMPPAATAIPSTEIVDSRQGIVLLLEQKDGLSRVIVKKAGQASWFLISEDDTSASSPALSSDATLVAYASKREGGQIRVVSIIDDNQRTITADTLRALGRKANIGELQVCPWTSIAWNTSGRQLAFFGCNAQRSLSIALVSEWSSGEPTLKVVTGSGIESTSTRHVAWLDDTHLFLTMPTAGTSASIDVATLSVP